VDNFSPNSNTSNNNDEPANSDVNLSEKETDLKDIPERQAQPLEEIGLYRSDFSTVPAGRALVPISGLLVALLLLTMTEAASDKWYLLQFNPNSNQVEEEVILSEDLAVNLNEEEFNLSEDLKNEPKTNSNVGYGQYIVLGFNKVTRPIREATSYIDYSFLRASDKTKNVLTIFERGARKTSSLALATVNFSQSEEIIEKRKSLAVENRQEASVNISVDNSLEKNDSKIFRQVKKVDNLLADSALNGSQMVAQTAGIAGGGVMKFLGRLVDNVIDGIKKVWQFIRDLGNDIIDRWSVFLNLKEPEIQEPTNFKAQEELEKRFNLKPGEVENAIKDRQVMVATPTDPEVEGIIIVPENSKSDLKITQAFILNMFSDPVDIDFDSGGRSGVITPRFRSNAVGRYIFLVTPGSDS